MIRRNVQIYIVSSTDHKLLMLKRVETKAGYWQPVCGGIENNESELEAAIRETNEETGINNYESIEKLSFTFKYNEPKNGVEMEMEDQCFLMKIRSQRDILLSDEHEEYKWCEIKDVSKLTDWNPIIAVCEHLDKVIKG